ncbi:GTP pyrophosphokinase family protein [Nesterenkonia sp. LB17]|uniref:GTP pyrophosphokinase n=1 Tax=unclassified Nesterenkonia TaxID=2629769 RepID=UPI001F4D1B6E|nr:MULTISPECIES: GTP pyrophosphokinase family protein [unclassified Nesterenkonia]MCH8559106.1 GTP pyrophosphokinase family protein [Nesterenkonia sp. DZ6]MCH8563020.1 GTP pyrophosphokinase family protein [Nesterenkonia sp. YGD6]MCH8565163.1 GTP pyrophosphokinase family protein [Nesterenkonia sp. LB17]MCH8571441.1 GTP pyrophosphokinase family protein [Nesterenkonia sp. AY15]
MSAGRAPATDSHFLPVDAPDRVSLSAGVRVPPGKDLAQQAPLAKKAQRSESDVYRALLSELHSSAGEEGDGVAVRMVDIRRQLTEFQLHYKFGMDEVLTKINVLREEFEHTRDYSPIEHVNYRLKSLDRILDKVQRYGCEPTLESIRHSIRDIAGIRITCSFVSDAYWVAEMLCSQPDLRVVEVKDYIRTPKVNGYQSLHVIVQVPVFLSNRTEFVYVEVQIRTVAMDFWASLEHKIYYTYDGEVPDDILDELRDAAVQAAALDQQMASIRDRVTALKDQAPVSGQGATGPTPRDRATTGAWFPSDDAMGTTWKWEDIAKHAGGPHETPQG